MIQAALATHNPGKLRELQHALESWGVRLSSAVELGIDAPVETGVSYVENALIKARHSSAQSGLPALADDSGVSVDALGGAPGLYSARYAGPGASDESNIDKLLAAMDGQENRAASFVCVMVWVRRADDPLPIIAQGIWQGRIANERSGESGFGYDPVFWLPQHACTVAQLSPEIKRLESHRAKALRKLAQLWVPP